MRTSILALVTLVAMLLSAGTALAQMYMMESTNFPGMYWRHFNFQGVLSKVESQQDKKDAVFYGVTGLSGFNLSLESYNFRGYYLRHKNFKIVLEKNDGSEQFKKDATFKGTKHGNLGYRWESVNFPGYFIRHKNLKLVLEKDDGSAQFEADSVFRFSDAGPVEAAAPPAQDNNPPPQDNNPPPAEAGGQATAKVDTTIYDEPDGRDIAYIAAGDAVTIVTCNDDNWCQIKKPKRGWVWGEDLNR